MILKKLESKKKGFIKLINGSVVHTLTVMNRQRRLIISWNTSYFFISTDVTVTERSDNCINLQINLIVPNMYLLLNASQLEL